MVHRPLLLGLTAILALGTAFAEPIGAPNRSTIEYPDGKKPSLEEVELGKTLFFDPRLSMNKGQSCASCHNPDLGFGDGMAKGHGTMGGSLGRNTPHLYNLAWNTLFFWDGRAASLEEQALGPIAAPGEMALPLDSLVPRLSRSSYYRKKFSKVYGKSGISNDNLAKAIAAFERTLISDNSPFDKYMKGDKTAMLPEAIRGMGLFNGKAKCVICHSGPNFTDEGFHNIGIGDKDEGRNAIMKGATLVGAFKTPGLRNVTLTAPYMHDGSEKTLEGVIELYNRGGNSKKNQSKLITPLQLTGLEVQDLVAFLGALSSPVQVVAPRIPSDD